MKRKLLLVAVMVLAIGGMGGGGAALAVKSRSSVGPPFKCETKPFNPGGAAVSIGTKWLDAIGLLPSIAVGMSTPEPITNNRGLVLSLSDLISAGGGASADCTIKPVSGLTLTGLEMDHQKATYCSAGAPRISVETAAGSYAFGCAYGTHTDITNAPAPANPGWEHIVFADADAVVLSGPAWPGFGTAVITFLQVLQDEAGTSILDNIKVNSTFIGNSGNCPSAATC